MKTKKMSNNKGYSLVEMIICIAIIAVLSAVAFVTVNLINSARAKDAAVSFETELSEMAVKSKNQICTVNGKKEPNYSFCMKVYKHTTGRYYYKMGYYNPKGTADGEIILSEDVANNGSYKYMFVEGENSNDDRGKRMAKSVVVRYSKPGEEQKAIDEDGIYIVFDRSGRCISGDGLFGFYRKNDSMLSSVTIQKNGSHQSK